MVSTRFRHHRWPLLLTAGNPLAAIRSTEPGGAKIVSRGVHEERLLNVLACIDRRNDLRPHFLVALRQPSKQEFKCLACGVVVRRHLAGRAFSPSSCLW